MFIKLKILGRAGIAKRWRLFPFALKKEYYSIDKVKFADSFEDVNNESMTIYSVLEGEGKIAWGENEELAIKKGETVLIPVGINTKTIGNFEILRTVI